tara:strand:+ start:628 stop:852 length:225 start_codon:yes stop_codon:yes gene_type:complete
MKIKNIWDVLYSDYKAATGAKYFDTKVFVKWLQVCRAHKYHDWFFDEDDDQILQIFYENRAINLFSKFINEEKE